MEEEGEQHPLYTSEFDFFVSNKEGLGATSSLILLFIWIFCQQLKSKGSDMFLFGDGRHGKEQHVGIIFSLFIQFPALTSWAAD